MSNALQVLKQEVFSTRGAFMASLADPCIKFEQEAGFAVQALQANDYLAGIAMQNRPSLVNAVTNTAAIGISLNPAKKQAYLVPRDGRVCLDISYMGLMDLAMATGAILWSQANVVREKDEFSLRGLDQKPHHVYSPFSTDRGDVVGVYVVVKTHHGDYLTHAMSIAEVRAIRDRSSAWKAWISKKKSCPWVTDEGEMAKKTCVKQAYKYWPKNARLEEAIHHMNMEGGEGLDFAARPGSPADLAAQADTAQDTPETMAILDEFNRLAATGDVAKVQDYSRSLSDEQRKAVGATRWEAIKQRTIAAKSSVIQGEAQEVPE